MRALWIGLGSVVGIGVLAVGGVLGAAATTQPDVLRVERSAVVPAPPAVVWPLVSDLRAFITWSPWQDLDPDQTTAFSDPSSGVGAWYTWEGDDKVGRGRMAITGVTEGRQVDQSLAFIEPFTSTASVSMRVDPEGAGSRVTWTMDSNQDLMAKVMGLFIDMDGMLGADFERGLGRLAEVAAKVPPPAPPPPEPPADAPPADPAPADAAPADAAPADAAPAAP